MSNAHHWIQLVKVSSYCPSRLYTVFFCDDHTCAPCCENTFCKYINVGIVVPYGG